MSVRLNLVLFLWLVASGALGCNRLKVPDASFPGVLVVEPSGVDIVLESNGTRLAPPTSRVLPRYIYIEEEPKVGLEVCVHQRYSGSDELDVRVTVLAMGDISNIQQLALRDMNEAARLWVTGSESSQIRALELWRSSSSRVPEPFSAVVRLYAAQAALRLYRLSEARELINGLSPQDLPPHLGYMVPWIEAEASMLNGDLILETRRKVESAISLVPRDHESDLAELMVLQSETYIATDELKVGIDILEDAKRYASRDKRVLAQIFNNLGYVAIRQSFLATSHEERKYFLEQSAAIHLEGADYANEADDAQTSALIYNNVGWVYEKLGDLAKAQLYLRKSLSSSYGVSSNRSDALIYSNLGNIYMRLGDLKKAKRFLLQAIESNESGESGRLPVIRCDLGTVEREFGNTSGALALHKECRNSLITELDQSSGDKASTLQRLVSVHIELAIDYLRLAQPELSASNLREAERFSLRADKEEARHSELATVRQRLRGYRELVSAKGGKIESLDLDFQFESIIDPTVRVEVMYVVFLAQVERKEFAKAISLGFRLLDTVEGVYAQVESERLAPAWSNKTHVIYDSMVDVLVNLHQNEPESYEGLLFAVVERSRAPSLRRRFSETTLGDADKLERLSELSNDLAFELNREDLALKRYRTHDAYLAKSANLPQVETPPVELKELQRSLGRSEAFLYFVLSSLDPFLLEVRKHRLSVHRLDKALDVPGMLNLTYERMSASSREKPQPSSMLSKLIPETLNLDDVQSLYFVLHKELHSLPTALLGYRGKFLNDSYHLQTVPSATIWISAQTQKSFELDLAVLADPIFGEQDLRDLARDDDAERSWSESLQRLPWTAAEAKSIQTMLDSDRVALFIGEKASRSRLFSAEAREARILHVATHGFFAGDDVDNVGFVLSPDYGKSAASFITLTELVNGGFKNELVVVSGCETARGERLLGEGPLSLTRAFLTQGVQHVVGTLWPVSDRASAHFMGRFYNHLIERDNVAEALSMAQSDMRSSARYRNPYYWAPYTLTSTGRAQMTPGL